MNIWDKEEVEIRLGKYGWGDKGNTNCVLNIMKYLGGIPPFDNLIENKKIDLKVLSVSFSMRPKGLEISLLHGFKTYRIGLLNEKLNFWTIEHKKDIEGKKSKSVVGRALLGGVLLGPVGAIVGGMAGIGDKSIKMSDVENVVSLSCNIDGKELMFLFSCKDKKLKKVSDFLKLNFSSKYKEHQDIKFEEKNSNKENNTTVADELIKLKGLMDSGVLTKEEFDIQKKNLLNH